VVALTQGTLVTKGCKSDTRKLFVFSIRKFRLKVVRKVQAVDH